MTTHTVDDDATSVHDINLAHKHLLFDMADHIERIPQDQDQNPQPLPPFLRALDWFYIGFLFVPPIVGAGFLAYNRSSVCRDQHASTFTIGVLGGFGILLASLTLQTLIHRQLFQDTRYYERAKKILDVALVYTMGVIYAVVLSNVYGMNKG